MTESMEQTEQRKLEFVKRVTALERELALLDRKYGRISTLRILSFLLGGALLAVGISDGKPHLTVVGALCLAGFFFLVARHAQVVKQQELAASKCEVAKRYVERCTEGWRDFPDAGADLLLKDDVVAADADLLGKNSLYQMLSVCHTEHGRRLFGKRLSERWVPKEERGARQQAVMELARKRDFAEDFEAAGLRLSQSKRKLDVDALTAYCEVETQGVLPAWARVLRLLLPAVELTFMALFFAGVLHYGYFLVGFITLLAFSWLSATVTAGVIVPVTAADTVIGAYEEMLSLLEKQEFESPLLKDMQEQIQGEDGAVRAFGRLHGISQAHNISFNPLVHQVLCGLLLWDYQLAAVVCGWKKKYGKHVAEAFPLLGQMEELLSLAVLSVVRDTSLPEISEGTKAVALTGEGICHPLLKPEQAQENPVKLSDGITIITGSNMSGKTTYLRTLAVNLTLAYIGAPVCARRLSGSYMKLFTSMRVTDDVAQGISTFYAEILRIKTMAEYRKQEKPMLCLIDEIFKGTNSADRIVGAREVITKLAGSQCMTVVSTHDFELCALQDRAGRDAVNYHFEEHYEGDELKFDYRIKNGRCTSTNARAILRMAGFSVQDV